MESVSLGTRERFAPHLLQPSQDAQFFKAPRSPLTQLLLDIVDQHTLKTPRARHGDCSCGAYVRDGKWQRHIDSVVRMAVNAYLAAVKLVGSGQDD